MFNKLRVDEIMGALDFLGPIKWLIVLAVAGFASMLIVMSVLFFPLGIFSVPLIVVSFGFIVMVFLGILAIKKAPKNCTDKGGKIVCDIP